MNRTLVFVGPSLSISRARAVLPAASYLPPIRRGDLTAALKERPAIVGIIDGQFLQSLAVSPLEIFAALRAGTVVLGAASMGALRAVEMSGFGMIGVGTIFRWFRDARLVAEDELAVAYDADTGSALSDALVNMRYAFSRAVAENVIGADTRRVLIRVARDVYFPERTYHSTIRVAESMVPAVELRRLRLWLRHRCPDLKADDALRLLRVAGRLSKRMETSGGNRDEPCRRTDNWQADHRSGVSTDVQGRSPGHARPLPADSQGTQRSDAIRRAGDRGGRP
jgi:hypothetical protein